MFADILQIAFNKTYSEIVKFQFPLELNGRCDTCKGEGEQVVEMQFLADVHLICESCGGKRFKEEVLEVKYKDKSIFDVLDMSVDEAISFFIAEPAIVRAIQPLSDVGLGYIKLGQSSDTLSGGEAQRVKLAAELSKRDTGNTFYILDEPTTGLHFEDVKILLDVLHKLVDKGNSVVVIEHNMDVIRAADHIIDLGPEGGAKGGTIICTGPPHKILQHPESYTAAFLKREMEMVTA